jgi:hypothetical protein
MDNKKNFITTNYAFNFKAKSNDKKNLEEKLALDFKVN